MPKRLSSIKSPSILEELKSFPNQGIIWGMLESNNPCQIWELPGTQAIILIEDSSDDPFVFIAGTLTAKSIETIIALCQKSYPTIYCDPAYHHLFLEKGWDFLLRVELSYSEPNIQLIQSGLSVKPIDNLTLFEKCYSFQETSQRYGSAENFLKFGRGFILSHADKILSEAYIDYFGENHAEIGIITPPEHRNQGYASQIASYLAEWCKEKQYIPIWSCQINNRASLKTAYKIGFRGERYYIQMVPTVGNTLGPPLISWLNKNPQL